MFWPHQGYGSKVLDQLCDWIDVGKEVEALVLYGVRGWLHAVDLASAQPRGLVLHTVNHRVQREAPFVFGPVTQ